MQEALCDDDRLLGRGEVRRIVAGVTASQALVFSAILCAAGSAVLWFAVNPLTMWLTFATFIGYAVIPAQVQPSPPARLSRRIARRHKIANVLFEMLSKLGVELPFELVTLKQPGEP